MTGSTQSRAGIERRAGLAPTFDFNLLPLAIAVHDAGTVTKAAYHLGLSQAAVSMALRKLRDQTGDAMFVRTAHGMVPTPRCRVLVDAARTLVGKVHHDLLHERPFAPAEMRGVCSFAMSDVGEMVFLPPILERLHRVAPHVAIRAVSLRPADLERALEEGSVDLAIGYFPDLTKSQFLAQRLFTHEFCCILRAQHPLAGDRLTLRQFVAAEHAVVRAEGRSQEVFEQYLKKRKITRRVGLMTPHFMSLPMIIERSDLIATVPHAVGAWFSRINARVRVIAPPFRSPRFDLKQFWHRRFQEDARNRWLRATVAELFNDKTDEWRVP